MNASNFLKGGGVMGARIQQHDWSASPLGPVDAWPQALRTVLGVMLDSKFPGYIVWGSQLISFYNDAYLPILGSKPDALGQPIRQVWPEIWDTISPIIRSAFRGEASYFEDLPLTLQRRSYPEQAWFTFSYSPIRDETGEVRGVFGIVHETTARVLSEQTLRFWVDLSSRIRSLADAREIMTATAEMLGPHLGASRVGYVEIGSTGEFMSVERDWTNADTLTFAGRYRLDDFGPQIISELKAGHTVRLNDASTDPRTAEEHIAAQFIRTGKRATIIVPLIKDGRLTASLYVHQAEPRHWRDDEVALAQEVAERTWTAVLRARAEAALKDSEERFRQFAEHSSTVLWILDLETRQLEYLSPAYETIWGEPLEAALGDPEHWIRTIHPDDRARASTSIERVLQGEEGTQEYHIIRPDGGVRWIRDTFFPIRDEQGRVRRAGGIAQDLTQHDGSIVYVVDGADDSRQDLCLLLQGTGYEVKMFASGQAFLDVAPVLVPGCVVLDTRSLEGGGLTIPNELKARQDRLPVIVVGEARGNVDVGVQAMKAGAMDFLDVPYQPERLLDAVASALASIRDVAERDQTAELAKARLATLSARERDVLDGLLAGGTNKTIARDLDISPRTVEAHRARIMERLGAQSLPELVQLAVMAGLQAKPQGSGHLDSG
jgi:PAS domain S-box-containing protein